MTHEEAEALCAKYTAEHPDRKVAQWRPQEGKDGAWNVVRIDLPPSPETTTEVAQTSARRHPPTRALTSHRP